MAVLALVLPACDHCASVLPEPDAGPDTGDWYQDPDASWEDVYCIACDDNDDQDSDGDDPLGSGCGSDCDDYDPARWSSSLDPFGDGVDTDCSGEDGQDWDRDGFFVLDSGGDCDDRDATVWPGAADNMGWVVTNGPFTGHLGSIAIFGNGLPFLTSGRAPGCSYDGDGDGVAEGTDVPGAAAIEVAFRHGGSWWMPERWDACVTSRIEATTTWLVGYAMAGVAAGDGRQLIYRLAWTPGWPELWESAAETFTRDSQPSFAVHECNTEVGMFVEHGERTIVTGFIWPEAVRTVVDPEPSRAAELRYNTLAAPRAAYIGIGTDGTETVRLTRQTPDVAYWRPGPWCTESLWGPVPEGFLIDVALAVTGEGQDLVAVLTTEGVRLLSVTADSGAIDELVDGAAIAWDGNPSTTVAVDFAASSGPHLAWVVPAAGDDHGVIRYASRRDGRWTVETLGEGDGWADVAVDQHGNPNVVWHTERRGDELGEHAMRYAVWSPIDGIDQNCDGVDGVDADGDGRASVDTGGDDADDTDPGV